MMSETLSIATESATAPAVAAIIESHSVMVRLQHTAERPESRFLLIGEALVQRSAGIGDLL